MSEILKTLGYSDAEIQKLSDHISDALSSVDPEAIGEDFKSAVAASDRVGAIKALADYYRARPNFDIPSLNGGSYSKEHADKGVVGKMCEINVNYDFGGSKINFLFNPTIENPPVNHEWLWQLNRHGWWGSMSKAYADLKDEKYAVAFNSQLLDWVAQTDIPEKWNAPGSAWRTIECGIRLMGSWNEAFNLFRHSKNLWDETLLVMLGSLHKQALHLFAHPTGGNWLLMETSGIYNFGSLYSEFKDAAMLRDASCKRVIEEMEKQVLPDGLQYELSPDYHVVSLNCAVNIYKIALGTGKEKEFPKEYLDCIYNMAMAAVRLSTPALTQPRTNDCYTMLTPRYTDFAARIFPSEPAFKFVNTRRAEGAPPTGDTPSVFMPWSGFVAMRKDWSADSSYLCFDVGPLGMGHWHQDKLNINLYKGEEELIFDDGGGQYEQSPERTYGLSAYDHNTVTVDGLGQSRREPKISEKEIDAGFISNDEFDYAYGVYSDTFEGDKKPASHKREVRFCKPDLFVIRDTLNSVDGEAHTYGLRFHMDTTTVKSLENGAIVAEYGKTWDLLVHPVNGSDAFTAYSAQKDPLLGWYIGRNESKNHPATTVIAESKPSKDYVFTTLLIPFKHGSELPTVKAEGESVKVTAEGKEYTVNISKLNK